MSYVIGLVAAVLTAYYMTRQVIMVFFGEAHWRDAAAEHGAHGEIKPHESPPTMLVPLVVLAGLALVGGSPPAALRFVVERLEHWLEPVIEFGEADISDTAADDAKYLLLVIAAVLAVAGIALAWLVYQKRRIKAVEPRCSPTPGTTTKRSPTSWAGQAEAAEGAAWFDHNVVDGAVAGTAVVVRDTAGELRKGQSGYLRAYAGFIGLGVVVLLAWFVVARAIL